MRRKKAWMPGARPSMTLQKRQTEMADIWNKYADTAARKHGKPAREMRPKSTTIDAHTHVAVPRAAEFIKPHLDVSTVPLAHFASAETKAINVKQEADIRGCMTGYDERFAIMDKMEIGRASCRERV